MPLPLRWTSVPLPQRAPVSMKTSVPSALAGGLAAAALVLGGVAALADSHWFQLLGSHMAHLPAGERSVALTFDDGPNPASTAAILDVLQRQRVPATFFLIGERIERDRPLAERILRDGHQLANHSWSHPRMVLEHPHRYATEIDRTDQLIRQLGYSGPIDFRPPYGQKLLVLPWLLAHRGKLDVLWSLDSRDWADRDPASIARRVVRGAQPGTIVLLHDLPRTAAALPAMIEGLRRRGYRFRKVRVSRSQAHGLVGGSLTPHSRRLPIG